MLLLLLLLPASAADVGLVVLLTDQQKSNIERHSYKELQNRRSLYGIHSTTTVEAAVTVVVVGVIVWVGFVALLS